MAVVAGVIVPVLLVFAGMVGYSYKADKAEGKVHAEAGGSTSFAGVKNP